MAKCWHARWPEIDFTNKLWTVPPQRMKAGVAHRMPLSERALAILREMKKFQAGEGALIFPGYVEGRPLSDNQPLKVLRRMGLSVTTHGFRSSFRDWAGNRTTFPREIAEEALAHTIGNAVERAYKREQALDKRRKLMAAWARYCEPKADNVIAMERSTPIP